MKRTLGILGVVLFLAAACSSPEGVDPPSGGAKNDEQGQQSQRDAVASQACADHSSNGGETSNADLVQMFAADESRLGAGSPGCCFGGEFREDETLVAEDCLRFASDSTCFLTPTQGWFWSVDGDCSSTAASR